MSPVSDDSFERIVDRVVTLERNHAVKDETLKGVEARLDAALASQSARLSAIEAILGRLTWLVASSVVGAVLAGVVYGGIPGVTK
jgi:hypothetical protein